jgi:hypothetical protein
MGPRAVMRAPRAVLLQRALAAAAARAAAAVRHHDTNYMRVVTMMWFMASTATKDPAGKSATAIRFPEELHERLRAAADERHYSINYMVVKAVEDFLERLIPVDELKLTRD